MISYFYLFTQTPLEKLMGVDKLKISQSKRGLKIIYDSFGGYHKKQYYMILFLDQLFDEEILCDNHIFFLVKFYHVVMVGLEIKRK